jgi:hypothetical protein
MYIYRISMRLRGFMRLGAWELLSMAQLSPLFGQGDTFIIHSVLPWLALTSSSLPVFK